MSAAEPITTSLASTIVEVLQQHLVRKEFVPLHEPVFAGNEWAYVKECIDTGWVSSVGKYVDEFERRLAEFTGVKRAVAVVNGTAALHMCLLLAGVEPNDEVLLPALTFIATANAVSYCHAVPHFVDSEEVSFGVDAHKLDDYLGDIAEIRNGASYNKHTGRRMRALVPMHVFGHPVDLDAIVQVCEKYHLVLIEDAAESIGSSYKGVHTGNAGFVSALSFNGNKVVTTGGGGAILTNDEEVGRRAKHLTTTAKVPHRWAFFHDETGFNYRMPNINAALGCAQLEQLPGFLSAKRALAERYAQAFAAVEGVRFVAEPAYAESNYWLQALLLDETHASERDAVLQATNDAGLMTRPVWTLMPKLPMYSACPAMAIPVAESVERRLVNIPSSANL